MKIANDIELICPQCRTMVRDPDIILPARCKECGEELVDVTIFFNEQFPESDDANDRKTKLRAKKR
jgi:NAD-dependent SIR2 family protein deacetylase